MSSKEPGARNLARLAEAAFERHGDYVSLVFEGREHRSGELHERARRLGGGLAAAGIAPRDRVVVMMANCAEVGLVYHALWRIGATVTPAVFLLSREDVRRILVDSEAVAVITTPEFLGTVRSAAEGVESVRLVVSTGEAEAGAVALAALAQAEPTEIVPLADSELAALMYTGGTTGRSKGVMLSHENLWLAGRIGEDTGYIPGITRGLTALPLAHAFGLLVTVVGLQSHEPGTAVLMRWFEPTAWLELAQEHAVQISAVVPSMLQLLLAQPLEDYDLSALRQLACGAAPLPAEVVAELARRLPGVEIREGYGLTETSALVSSNPPGRVRPGSVGLPVAGTEVTIVDERDRELPVGEVGEICCRSEMVMRGYWRDPEQTAEVMRGGALHTGDMGRLDEDGYLYVVDRKKDVIIRGGFNVFPRDVEEALLEHPAIGAVCVVGRPDVARGEEVVAFVSLRAGYDTPAGELEAFGKERLGGYKYPREVRVLSSLPFTPVGKIDRKALRALLAAEGGAT